MEDRYEKIDDYLNNQLEGVEREAFEKELKQDKAFAKELEVYKQIRNAMGTSLIVERSSTDLKKSLNGLGAKYFVEEKKENKIVPLTQEKSSRSGGSKLDEQERIAPTVKTEDEFPQRKTVPLWKRILPALAIAALLAIGGFFAWNQLDTIGQPNYTELATAQYSTQYTTGTRSGSASQTLSPALEKGVRYYRNKEYAKAIDYFEKLKNKTGQSQMYLASSYFESGEYGLAMNRFRSVVRAKDKKYKEEAEWKQALSYLGYNQVEDAKKILGNIKSNTKHLFNQKATKLLENL